MLRKGMHSIGCALLALALSTSPREADAKPKPKVVGEVPLKVGKAKEAAAVLKKARLVVKGDKLTAAPGYKLIELDPKRVGVVKGDVNIDAVKVPLGSIIVIDDSKGQTVLLCGGMSCKSCEFNYETTNGDTTCEGCGTGHDCSVATRQVGH